MHPSTVRMQVHLAIDVYSPRNMLLMHSSVKKALDRKQLMILPEKEDEFKVSSLLCMTSYIPRRRGRKVLLVCWPLRCLQVLLPFHGVAIRAGGCQRLQHTHARTHARTRPYAHAPTSTQTATHCFFTVLPPVRLSLFMGFHSC